MPNEANTTPQYDIDGSDVATTVLLTLLNQYPALGSEDSIAFATLSANRGKAMYPLNGGVIQSTVTDIWGDTVQTCIYPFIVIYRTGNLTEDRRKAVKEWLDNLGRWLERQEIVLSVDGVPTTYHLTSYPAISDSRTITGIQRTAPSYLNGENDNGTEDWAISISATYENRYRRTATNG